MEYFKYEKEGIVGKADVKASADTVMGRHRSHPPAVRSRVRRKTVGEGDIEANRREIYRSCDGQHGDNGDAHGRRKRLNIMKEAPAGAATPFAGAGNNPYTDCITIPLEEYKKTLEMATELGIIRELAGDQNVYLILAKSQPDSMVPMAEYESLQNTMAIKIKHLEDELKTKTSIIESLTNSQTAGHICPVCERVFYEEPAISRRDPGLKICSVCATTEALEDAQAAGAISKGDANEILEIVEEVVKETEPEEMMEDVPAGEEGEEVVPRVSTPEQCKRGGKKNKPGTNANLPMEEICELKKQGWSNVRIAKKYGVTDVTIGSRLKQFWAEQELTVEKIRILRKEGWTYEKIEAKYGVPEDKIREMLREAGKAERSTNEDK